MTRLPLHERALFWLGLGGALIVLGGIGVGIGTAVAAAAKPQDWSNPPFIVGAVVVVVGLLCLWWALTLHIAHRHAEKHWCPDPEAHSLPSTAALAGAAPATANDPGFQSVLRQLRLDVRTAIRRLENAARTERYWKMSESSLATRAWTRNRKHLSELAASEDLLEALDDAFKHVQRINGLQFPRWFQGYRVKPGDDLEGALAALRQADAELDRRLKGAVGGGTPSSASAPATAAGQASGTSKLRAELAANLDAVREFRTQYDEIMGPSRTATRNATASDYETAVRAEIGRLCVIAFRPIKLNQGEREAFVEAVFRACSELGWEAPEVSVNPVDAQHLEMGWAWIEGPVTITSHDAGALRDLANERGRMARTIRDSELGRLFRETYIPKLEAPGSVA
jgi:hypothetical protein